MTELTVIVGVLGLLLLKGLVLVALVYFGVRLAMRRRTPVVGEATDE